MLIELTDKEIKSVKHLGNALNSGVIITGDLQNLLDGIQRKIEHGTAGPSKRNSKKQSRKDKYRIKLAS